MDAQTPFRSLLYGGLAGAMAESITIPVDVVKVRMQLQGEGGSARQYRNSFDAFRTILAKEGPLALTKGLKAAAIRQLTYGSLRFGLYAQFKESLGVSKRHDSALGRKLLAGVTSGGMAAYICNPADLIKVRMQADGMRPDASSQQYRGVVHAATSIVKHEGFRGLYKGANPTSARAAVVAASEIVSYDEIKVLFLRRGWLQEGVPLHLVSALISGFVATLCSSPFDVVKSRLMTQPFDSNGVGLQYRGMLDCFVKSFRHEGVRFAFKGFWPNYMNKGPSVLLLFVFYEQLRKLGDSILGEA